MKDERLFNLAIHVMRALVGAESKAEQLGILVWAFKTARRLRRRKK